MTERIEHATEAVNFLGAVTYDTHGDDDRKVQLAQVHATLALVEQQRIATIAALAVAPQAGELGYLAALALCTPADPEVHGSKPQVRQETREVLGL